MKTENALREALEVQHCNRCLYTTDHPLGLIIDDTGICSGCRVHDEKDALDWADRFEKLNKLVGKYKSKSINNYDCIVPVSGGMDSYFIVDVVKNKLGLNPLLVTYNKYWNTKTGIANLANLRIKFNCDLIIQNVNPNSVKKITRTTLKEFGSIYWHCIAGQTVFPVQVAVTHRIPLIVWGGHQGVEQVGMFSHEHEVEMTRRYRKDHDLMGYEADDLISIFNTLNEEDIWQYRYPNDAAINEVGVNGIYLSNYVRWDPKAQHEEMISKYGYRTSCFDRTFDCYDFVDCFNYMHIHDTLKLYKHGYSKVTDHVCREIRHGRITREQGLALVRKYELRESSNLSLFCEWLGLERKSLQWVMDTHRNVNYWDVIGFRKWRFNGVSCQQSERAEIETDFDQEFIGLAAENTDDTLEYITFGKGYPC